MNNSEVTGNFLNFNQKYNYVIQWLYESELARDAYRQLLFRTALAKEGLPSKNLYQDKMLSNINRVNDESKRAEFRNMCACLPIGRSFALLDAVENRANQLAGGVDTYECEVNDPYMVIDDETEDLLSAKCQQDYVESGVKDMAAQFSDDLTWAGVAAVVVKYCPETDTNEVLRVNPKNIWFDTKYSSVGKERFRGYSQMISFDTLLKMIEKDGDEVNPDLEAPDRSIFNDKGKVDKEAKYNNHHIDTINGLRIYIEDLNKLATSTSLQGDFDRRFTEYSHDLHSCYNLGWYRTYANDPEARTKSGYNGDDVELTVIYDLARKIEFKVINRRYVISANSKAFRRNIPYEIINPFTQTIKIEQKEYCLNCPLIFKFERRNMDMKPYPQAPVFPLLDEHDEVCALIAKRKHVTDILSLLRIVADAADADSLQGLLNIMGVVLDDIQGDIQTVSLNYNYEPIDSEINRLESEIKKRLKGYDEFDALQAMGDRASAAESGMATGAIAQGLSTLQQTVMGLYAEIARLCIGNRVTYAKDGNFRVYNAGDYSVLSIQEMSLLTIVDVKPKLAKKMNERMLASNAMTLLGSIGPTLPPEGQQFLISQALFEQVPRRLIGKFVGKQGVTPETISANATEAQNLAQMLQQNQQAYESNPTAYEAVDAAQSMSPDELDQVIASYSSQLQSPSAPAPAPAPAETEVTEEAEVVDMPNQEQGYAIEGTTPEIAGMLANANSLI